MNESNKSLPPSDQDDEVDFVELIGAPVRQWKWMVMTPIVTLALAFGAINLVKPQWQVTTTLMMGQIGQLKLTDDRLIEQPQTAANRLTIDGIGDSAFAVGLLRVEPDQRRLFRTTITSVVVQGTPLVTLKVRTYSEDEGKRMVTALTDYLIAEHTQAMVQAGALSRARLESVNASLKDSNDRRAKLIAAINGAKPGSRESDVLTNLLLSQQTQEIRELEDTSSALTSSLDKSRTFPTARVGEVSVSEDPVSPPKASLLGMAAIAGLALGFLISLAMDQRRRRRAASRHPA